MTPVFQDWSFPRWKRKVVHSFTVRIWYDTCIHLGPTPNNQGTFFYERAHGSINASVYRERAAAISLGAKVYSSVAVGTHATCSRASVPSQLLRTAPSLPAATAISPSAAVSCSGMLDPGRWHLRIASSAAAASFFYKSVCSPRCSLIGKSCVSPCRIS